MARPSSKRSPRVYDNRLRLRQAEETRARILDAVVDELAAAGEEPLSIARVAVRAGVSEPTVYRGFANRELLLAAVNEHIRDRLGAPPTPARVEDMPATAVALYSYYAENTDMLRATQRTGAAQEVRDHGRIRRSRDTEARFAPLLADLPEAERRAVLGLFKVLLSGMTWLSMESHGVSGEAAGAAVGWATQTLLAELGKQRRKSLISTELREAARALRPPKVKGGSNE